MEKRNFVTSVRTTESSNDNDTLIKSAASLFSGSEKNVKQDNNGLEKKACREDEKTDRQMR